MCRSAHGRSVILQHHHEQKDEYHEGHDPHTFYEHIEKRTEYLAKMQDFIRNSAQIRGKEHPRQKLLQSINQLGFLQNQLYKAYPQLRRFETILTILKQRQNGISIQQFDSYMKVLNRSVSQLNASTSPFELWAWSDSVETLKKILPFVELPKDSNQQQQQQNQQQQQQQQKQQQQQSQQNKQQGQQQQQKSQTQDKEKKPKERKEERIDEHSNDEYQVHNKDLQAGDARQYPQFSYFFKNEVHKNLLRKDSFDNVDQNLIKIPGIRAPRHRSNGLIDASSVSDYMLVINKHSAQSLSLPYPYLMVPKTGDYGTYTVREKYSNEFVVEAKPGTVLPKKVKIALVPEDAVELTPAQKAYYLAKSQIQLSQWPDHVQSAVALAHSQKDTASQAAALAKWFRKDGPYLYNSRNKGMEEQYDQAQEQIAANTASYVVALAEAKMFNCDGAALIGARLLRDQFGLAARVVGGRPLSAVLKNKRTGRNQHFAINIKDPRHAWVEVFINGKWIPFDFTPENNAPENDSEEQSDQPPRPDSDEQRESQQKNDQEGQKQKSESKSQQKTDQQSGEPSDQESDSDQQSGDSQSPGKGRRSDKVQVVNKSERKFGDEIQQDAPEHDGHKKGNEQDKSESSETQAEQNSAGDENLERDQQEQARKSSHDQKSSREWLEKEQISNASVLPKDFDSVFGALFRQILSDSMDVLKGREASVSNVRSLFAGLVRPLARLPEWLAKAQMELEHLVNPFFRDNDKSIVEILSDAKGAFYKNPTVTYQKLKILKHYYESKARLSPLSDTEKTFLKNLQTVLDGLKKFRHPNSAQHELINSMLTNLPGDLLKTLIQTKHPGALDIGTADQAAFFDEIVKGEWMAAFQASFINKHFNFFLNAEKEYRTRRTQTMLRSYLREKRSEGIVTATLKDIADFQRWIFDPEIAEDATTTFLSRLLKDEQYMMANREMINSPGRNTPIERKHTNIFFDVSGSMSGNKAEVQSSAIIAMVDKFLSEKDPYGRPLHSVTLFPFGDTVGQGHVIQTREEAIRFIESNLNRPTESNSGTQFQPCFDTHFDVIRQMANDNSLGIKLTKTNMVLITDGEASVNLEKVQKDLASLPDRIRTFFNLVILEGKAKEELKTIVAATNSEKSKAMITELSAEMIQKFVADAHKPKVDPDAFVFDKNSASSLPREISASLNQLQIPNSTPLEVQKIIHTYAAKVKGFENIKPSEVATSQLVRMRDYMRDPQLPGSVKSSWTAVVLENYQKWFGNSLERLSYVEEKLVRDIIKEAQK